MIRNYFGSIIRVSFQPHNKNPNIYIITIHIITALIESASNIHINTEYYTLC